MSFITPERNFILIRPRPIILRLVFFVAILALAAPLIYRSYHIFRADRIVRSEQTFESYSRAIECNSENATFWWHRGRLAFNSITNPDIAQAINDYRKALSLNPRLGQAWADLAVCFEQTGDGDGAKDALEKAIAARPYSPAIRWQAGNFYLRQGDLEKMYRSFKLACTYDGEKLPMAINLAWKVDSDRRQILNKLIPDTLQANLAYLNFLVTRNELDLAEAAWKRCLEIPADFEFKPGAAFPYIDRLLAQNRVDDALLVWDQALGKAGTGIHDQRLEREVAAGPEGGLNLVWNGSFELQPLQGGFDWRYSETPEVQFDVDVQERLEGVKSLKITFGDSNISFAHLSQIVPLPQPGDYTLEFCLRSEGLTTDQKPYFALAGYPVESGAALRTGMFPESTPWSKTTAHFSVGPGCKAIRLTLRRDRSEKFNNKLKGTLWLDRVRILRNAE
jgi:hypothetical protein